MMSDNDDFVQQVNQVIHDSTQHLRDLLTKVNYLTAEQNIDYLNKVGNVLTNICTVQQSLINHLNERVTNKDRIFEEIVSTLRVMADKMNDTDDTASRALHMIQKYTGKLP